MRLLLVEDSARLRDLLTERVRGAGWMLDAVGTIAAATEASRSILYDLVLIDLGLPDGDGKSLIKSLRAQGSPVPILVLTARGSIDDRVEALDCGADDFLIKPFNHIEFLARCRALLRRSGPHRAERIEFGRLEFDPASGSVRVAGAIVPVSPRERSLLELLLRHADRVVPKERIEIALSAFGEEISTNAVELAISRLRRRLEPVEPGIAIETVRGAGYLLREVKAACLSGFGRRRRSRASSGRASCVFALLAMAVQVGRRAGRLLFRRPQARLLDDRGRDRSLGQGRERRPGRPDLRGPARHEALPGIERRLFHPRSHTGGARRVLELRRELRAAPPAAGSEPARSLVSSSAARQADRRRRVVSRSMSRARKFSSKSRCSTTTNA